MDGRLIPEHPDELEPDINMNEALAGVPRLGDYEGGSFGIRNEKADEYDYYYPGRYISYEWDGANMRITNFEAADQFVKREYRKE